MDPTTCKTTKADGTPCGMAPGASGYCFAHDPARADERDEARRRGGRVRSGDLARAVLSTAEAGTLELQSAKDVHRLLAETIQHARTGRLDCRIAATVGSLAGVLLRALEQGDLETRLAEMEAAWPELPRMYL